MHVSKVVQKDFNTSTKKQKVQLSVIIFFTCNNSSGPLSNSHRWFHTTWSGGDGVVMEVVVVEVAEEEEEEEEREEERDNGTGTAVNADMDTG